MLSLYIESEFDAQARPVLQQARDMRACVVLFDGIDEASDLREQVETFVVKVLAPSGIRLVVTSRPEGVRAALCESSGAFRATSFIPIQLGPSPSASLWLSGGAWCFAMLPCDAPAEIVPTASLGLPDRSGWVVMNLARLKEQQQHAAISTQLKGDEFFEKLAQLTKIRREHDKLYARCFTRDEQQVIENFTVRNALLLAEPSADAHRDCEGLAYDASMRQRTLDGQRIIRERPASGSFESAYISSLDGQMRASGVLTAIDAALRDESGQGLQQAAAGHRVSMVTDTRVSLQQALAACAPSLASDGADKVSEKLASWLQLKRSDGHRGLTAEALWEHVTRRTDELYVVAQSLFPIFEAGMQQLAAACDGKVNVGPLKDPVRVCEKAENDYQTRFGDSELAEACVGDILRATVVCKRGADYVRMMKMLQLDGGYGFDFDGQRAQLELVKMNNRFRVVDPTHFRFVNVFMMLSYGAARISVELQVHQVVFPSSPPRPIPTLTRAVACAGRPQVMERAHACARHVPILPLSLPRRVHARPRRDARARAPLLR